MKKLLVTICSLVTTMSVPAQTSPELVPENLGLGLRQLATLDQRDQSQARDRINSARSIMSDGVGRVVVNIYLDGKTPVSDLSAKLADLGLEIMAVDASWHNGVISAWLPISQATTVANLAGVRSVMLAPRPIRHVGVVTAESSTVEHAREVNTAGSVTAQGILGRGISVGIVSDSFDSATGVARASVGVASGDLPGPGNPDGYTDPVVILKDGSSTNASDEGRAMAEIVHDIAPAAKICFSTNGATQVTMAASIRNLRTNPQTLCDVIVDDIGFADEPFFSDGIIAQAVDDVVTSNSLPGKKVVYFSASGNNNGGYAGDANIISSTAARPFLGNINLARVPIALYGGGFHNLSSNSTPVIAMAVTTDSETSHEIAFQWDDPFSAGAVTTDYNLLVFDESGNYLASVSGTDNSFATGEPLEIVDLKPSTSYQLVISLRSPPATARHLRFISTDGGVITGPYISNEVISIFGHATAANANCVAAYVYNGTPDKVANYNPNKTNPPPGPYEPELESFNARGGSLPFYFNAQGQRLASPEIRLKPEFAAADGVDTSFFPPGADADYDNDGYPNFFGTSAAAPNAAAFAALVLEAAGGPVSLSPAQVRSILEQSGSPHDLDLNSSKASASAGTASVQVTASGDASNQSATSPTFFTVTFAGQPGETLNRLTIDLTNTSLVFDPTNDLGFPFTVGDNAGSVSISSDLSSDLRVLTLTFGNTFAQGKSISFGLDRDLLGIKAGGNSADLLAGASVAAAIDSGQVLYGAFANQLGNSFAPTEGFGLLDAKVAVESIVGKKSLATGVPANLSTRGSVGIGDNVLIGGVIVSGAAAKKVIIRALGPSLPIADALSDPALDLYNGDGQKFATNDNWADNPNQAAQVQASGIPPSDPRESALVETVNPGAYTAIVRGANSNTGIGLVEVYDLDNQPSVSRLANISTRGVVQTGDNVLIGGFILNQRPSQVVVRALGPSLAAAGVAGFLGDPAIELRDNQGNLVMANDNWQQNAFQAIQLQTIGLAPVSPLESALTTTINPGAFTAIVRGAQGTIGVGLVEVYNLP